MNMKRLEGQFGAGRRRVYWAREGGLIQQGLEIPITLGKAVITGFGIAAGLAIFTKVIKRK